MNSLASKWVICDHGEPQHGLLIEAANSTTTVIHIHGTGGNFYANPFLLPLAIQYQAMGLSFLTINVPGHDETAAFERTEHFTPALDHWIEDAVPEGRIVLQGHSLGALKVLHYLQDADARFRERVVGVILLAPFDIVAFYSGGKPGPDSETVEQLTALLHVSGPDVLVPPTVFDYWPMSVGTYLKLLSEGNDFDQFPSRRHLAGAGISTLPLPVFVAIGGEDFAAFPNPQAVVDMVREKTAATTVLVLGAPHNFANFTAPLTQAVAAWVGRQIAAGM